MKTIVGLFRRPERVGRALAELDAAGVGADSVRLVASPTSAGAVAARAANELQPPGGGFVDLGVVMGGQAQPGFDVEELRTVEERVAQGDTLVHVQVADAAAQRVEEILRAAGADRVLPGTIRD